MGKKEKKKEIKRILVYAGSTKAEYDELLEDIGEINNRGMKLLVVLAGMMLLTNIGISFMVPAIYSDMMWYAVALIALALFRAGVYQLETWRVRSKEGMRRSNYLLAYGLLLLIFVFAILLGTVKTPQLPAVFFPVVLCAAPLIFADRPYKMAVFLTAVAAVFCVTTCSLKEPGIAVTDCLHTLYSLVMTIVFFTYGMCSRVHDMTQSSTIVKKSERDGLTKLLRKESAEEEIKKYMLETGDSAVMLVLDVDNFKSVNDIYGHTFGDAVLRTIAECITDTFRETDIKGRFGGDEFVIFITHIGSREVVVRRVETLLNLMKRKIVRPDTMEPIAASVGIALYPEHACTYEELFSHADEALYHSKNSGKNCYTFYLDNPCSMR